MNLIFSVWDLAAAVLIFLLGIAISTRTGRYFDITLKRSIAIYFWHTFFCIIYAQFAITNGGDAEMYYLSALNGNIEFAAGTAGIQFITVFFTSILGLSFLGTSLVYNLLGTIGLLAFDGSLRKATLGKRKKIRQLATLITFLPSISFWSAGLGKDSISFMATGIMLWATLQLKRRYWLFVLSCLIMLVVRPHIAALMVIAFTVSNIIQNDLSPSKRLIFGIISIATAIILIPFAMHYAGVSNTDQLGSYIQKRQAENLEGGSSIDISSMPLPIQLFTYLFRPLPFEANSLFSLAASFDNLILLFLFIFGGWQIIRHRHFSPGNRSYLWIYSLSTWLILAITTSNLGIAVRQKWMFAPMLIYLLISSFNNARKPFIPSMRQESFATTLHGKSKYNQS